MTIDRDRILSEFIDSWNAGRRPDIDEHLARAPDEERDGLLEDITSYMSWAPTPDYDDATLQAIREEPAVAAAFAGYRQPTSSWAEILAARRQSVSLSTEELAARLVKKLGLTKKQEPKTRTYLEQAERGELDSSRFAPRLVEALSELLATPRTELGRAAQMWKSVARPAAASPAFRAGDDAALYARDDLELMADMAAAPSEREWDEVDELFRGAR